MIVWTGRGFISVIVLIVSLFLCLKLIPKDNADYAFVIAPFIAGIFSWIYGVKWNAANDKIVIDESTNEQLIVKNDHSLFWTPLQYWGIIFPVLGIIILIQESLRLGIISSALLVGFILISFIMKKKEKSIELDIPIKNETRIKPTSAIKDRLKVAEIVDEATLRLRKEKEDPSRFMPK